MGDVTNDGRADVIGFKMNNGTYVAKGETTNNISAPTKWTSSFTNCKYFINKLYR